MVKILIAEDEFTNRKLMEIKLQRAGIAFDCVSNGEEALDQFLQNDYNLVVLDQFMPGMNGSEVAEEIRKKNATVPIIGITSDETQRERLLQTGFDDVFIKPLRNQDYISTLMKYLE